MAEAPQKPAAVTVARWTGELLWPQDLPEAAVIDLARVTALGTWAYAWFAARPQQAATGASPALKRQLQRAGVLPAVVRPSPRPGGGERGRARPAVG